jgi:phage baseplate assembly protein V
MLKDGGIRAGQDRTWHAQEPGEQVVGNVYRDAHPAPGDTGAISRTVFKDGAVLEYDRQQHNHLLDVLAGGAITLHIGQTTLVLRDDGATLTTPNLLVDSPSSKFTGHVEIAGGLSVYNSGGGAADFVGDISHSDGDCNQQNGNHVLTGGDVTADGIGLKPHKHIEQGDGSPTSSSVA